MINRLIPSVTTNPPVEILEFINNFKSVPYLGIYKKDLEKLFNGGLCYHFSSILLSVYPNGEIYYDQVDDHFLFKYLGSFYDITGRVSMTPGYIDNLIPFTQLESFDNLLYQRVVDQVIYKVIKD